jgi:hypothetical protein
MLSYIKYHKPAIRLAKGHRDIYNTMDNKNGGGL